MVRAYFPQRANRSIDVNTNYPPQGIASVASPAEAAWIDNLGDEFIDDLGEVIVFTS